MKAMRWIYPSLVGLLLGTLQTGLYFQLSFTLSSSFSTFLMVTVSWLVGSLIGIRAARNLQLQLNGFILLSIAAYFACAVLLGAAPFNTQLWSVYAIFIVLAGLYPGVFFVRVGVYYSASELFFKENNGFIVGLVGSALLFLVLGRGALWMIPPVVAVSVMICSNRFLSWQYSLESALLETNP